MVNNSVHGIFIHKEHIPVALKLITTLKYKMTIDTFASRICYFLSFYVQKLTFKPLFWRYPLAYSSIHGRRAEREAEVSSPMLVGCEKQELPHNSVRAFPHTNCHLLYSVENSATNFEVSNSKIYRSYYSVLRVCLFSHFTSHLITIFSRDDYPVY